MATAFSIFLWIRQFSIALNIPVFSSIIFIYFRFLSYITDGLRVYEGFYLNIDDSGLFGDCEDPPYWNCDLISGLRTN
jgi:hypothetical protein